jgi:hypothetical protein
VSRRRPRKGCRAWIAALRNLPAYGAWNVKRVAVGTGEALPGPAACEIVAGVSCPITGLRREVDEVPGGRRRRP